MKKDEIVSVLEGSEGKKVRVVDVNGKELTGVVEVFESRYDNSDDDYGKGEASVCLDAGDGGGYLLYERDIESVVVIG